MEIGTFSTDSLGREQMHKTEAEKTTDRNTEHGKTGWASEHGSVLFLAVLVCLGALLLYTGVLCSESSLTWVKVTGVFLTQLGGIAVTAATVSAFMSFRDIRETKVDLGR